MLRGSKNKMLVITTLCCLLVFMGVGYAILSTQINLSGAANLSGIWDIEIVDMKVLSKKGMAEEGKHSYDGLTANFSHKLYAPGDSIEYEITIENKGNIKASLNQLSSSISPKYNDLILTNTLLQGQTLDEGEKLTFTVKSEFDIKATQLPSNVIEPKYEIEILFYQYEGNEFITPPDIGADDVCFTVSNSGELIDYDYEKCGSTMTVPESVNGINVTKIGQKVFDGKKYNQYLKSLGYKRTKYFNMYTDTAFYWWEVYLFATEEEKQQYLNINNFDEVDQYWSWRMYRVADLDNIAEQNILLPDMLVPIDDKGDYAFDSETATHFVYEYYVDDSYFVVENEEDREAAVLYAEINWGLPPENVFVLGVDDIPFKHFYNMIESSNSDDVSIYYDANMNWLGNHAKNILDTLDLSKANYLTEIDFDNVKVNNVYFPNSLKTISDLAFQGAKLSYVSIPASVTSIGTKAFGDMQAGSVIKVNRPKYGMTLGTSWNGKATVSYTGY